MSLLTPRDLTAREQRALGLAHNLAEAAAPHVERGDRLGDLPPEVIAALKASALPALTVPEPLGGFGATLHEFALVQERLGRTDASLALTVAMNGHVLGSAGESGSWPSPLYERVAQAAVTRGALTNALASEPELGSPSRGGLPKTRAVHTPGGWRVTGRKTWSTGAPALDFLLVAAAVDDEVWRFLIPAHAEGVRVERTWGDGLALRGSSSHDFVFQDVFVPHHDVVKPAPAAPSGSAWFWTAVAATYLGVGMGALDALVRYARERVPTALGEPIATLPAVRAAVGEIELTLARAQALLHRASRAWSVQPQERASLLPHFAAAKFEATNAAVRASDLALRAAGGAALTRALPLERFFRDARAGLMHPPSDNAALQMIGSARLDAE